MIDPQTAATLEKVRKLITDLLAAYKGRAFAESLREIQREQDKLERAMLDDHRTYHETIASMRAKHTHEIAALQEDNTALKARVNERDARIRVLESQPTGPAGLQGMPTSFQVRNLNGPD